MSELITAETKNLDSEYTPPRIVHPVPPTVVCDKKKLEIPVKGIDISTKWYRREGFRVVMKKDLKATNVFIH